MANPSVLLNRSVVCVSASECIACKEGKTVKKSEKLFSFGLSNRGKYKMTNPNWTVIINVVTSLIMN